MSARRWDDYAFLAVEHEQSAATLVEVSSRAAPTVFAGGPAELDFRPDLFPVRDQGKQNACVAVSLVQVLEWNKRTSAAELQERLSPQFVFSMRALSSTGMLLGDGVRVLTELGACYERSHPYNSKAQITPAMRAEAARFRIRGATVTTRPNISADVIKQALVRSGPCTCSFLAYNTTRRPWEKRPGNNVLGFHQVCLVGYSDILAAFIVRNSWGSDWADGGDTFLPYAEVAGVLKDVCELFVHDLAPPPPFAPAPLPTPAKPSQSTKAGCCACM